MTEELSRTEALYGEAAMEKLKNSRVAVFGVGGVGGYTVEALARSGIGALDLIDKDVVSLSNINRQILALHSTVDRYKVDVAEERIRDINPDCRVRAYRVFYLPETQDQFDLGEYDYVVDAIDTVTGKLTIIENAVRCKTPVISSMGAGNKTCPALFEVADLYDTEVCPLAKVMRRECRKRGIEALKVVYSKEAPVLKRRVPGSVAFVPSVAGLIIAGEIVNDLTEGLRTAENKTEEDINDQDNSTD
ncbi:MAG: tRNA threonylcarbamoyladenosine dehydratase [Lachnospiraceae bacterium]|nr:tRNA threonylcarbamoyladenosine dehydratase [Lachnospiraceae bacterium]